ncbi:MAG: sigma-54 dependent transcriptional regulator [Gammaproteobacteria bacterium]|nr:sigma-54 dependent transcriptional regulator [Gammaproteobacteria bacterium]MCW8987098.1 sigma-54 dependent transcriptional regulator [Gammaproteobacteria bacterium]MCW9031704.1 sigma-54 dependent transcriptional regulator [Gammaproteobacteria bacterium]
MQPLNPMEDDTAQNNVANVPYILVVDDEPDIRHLVQEILEDEGYDVKVAENGETARLAYKQQQPSLILLDIWMPDVDGITLLKEWAADGNLPVPVIMMSGHGTVETAVEATRLGAYDFIEKPLSLAKLLLTVEQVLNTEKALREPAVHSYQGLIVSEPQGRSPVMQRLREQIKRISEHDSWVLLNGEAGSGIRVAAYYLHANSHQHDKNFVEVNLSSLSYDKNPEDFVGQSSGHSVTQGLFDKAQGGTLFLCNIDEADEATQNFLLGFLQNNTYQHIGDSTTLSFKARIVCSSHKNLEKLVEENKFRKDLYYLINVVPLHIPALREHHEDIPDLLNYYTNVLVDQEKLPYRHFSLAAQNRLRNYEWLGNIRELTNLVQHLLITASGNEISLEEVESAISQKVNIPGPREGISVAYDLPMREARELFERDYLVHHLIKSGGSIGKVANLIGMERTHLYRKLRALNIDPKTLLIETR